MAYGRYFLPACEVINQWINAQDISRRPRLPGYSYALDAEHCRDDADATWAKEDLSASCASQECIRNIPTWMAEILNFTAQRLGRLGRRRCRHHTDVVQQE